MSLSIHAQVVTNHITIRGERYEFVDDMNLDYRTQPQRPVRYARLDHNDLNTYLTVFIRDAIFNEENLNLSVNYPNTLITLGRTGRSYPINTLTLVDHDSFYGRDNRVRASSWGSLFPGFLVTISDLYWNGSSSRDKLRVFYHELGHALLWKDHVCDVTQAWTTPDGGRSHQLRGRNGILPGIMSTGECEPQYGGSGYRRIGLWCAPTKQNCESFGEYDFLQWDDLLRHFYDVHRQLTTNRGSVPITGKGTRVFQPIHD